jgi:uncharacterized membrane protein
MTLTLNLWTILAALLYLQVGVMLLLWVQAQTGTRGTLKALRIVLFWIPELLLYLAAAIGPREW